MLRSAGILMHISSLPSEFGIGTLGKESYDFVDFLKSSAQSYWQVLPVGPTGFGNSPYQSFSSYAGNPYFIDFNILNKDKLLLKEDYQNSIWCDSQIKVDYKKLYNLKFRVLKKAYNRFKNKAPTDFKIFCNKNLYWLDDYALYMAVKEHFSSKCWLEWPDNDIKLRKSESINYYSNLLDDDIGFWKFIQFVFYSQWEALKNYANKSSIKIIGDIPIYVSIDSADIWSNQEVFWLDKNNYPVCVAGCPPDSFSPTGQLWGNPLYNWEYLKSTNYKWWVNRLKNAFTIFDTLRIDHFRGFESYYAIPYGAKTAQFGSWKKGPGIDFFKIIKKELNEPSIIAEDLGFLTDEVLDLLKATGYPGMKVIQFAFNPNDDSCYLPHNYNKNSVVYTGTHDNNTTVGWFNSTGSNEKIFATSYMNISNIKNCSWNMIRTAYMSVSSLAIVQMQDFLSLDGNARMNTPSTTKNNWVWRVDKSALTNELAKKIKNMTILYRRNNINA